MQQPSPIALQKPSLDCAAKVAHFTPPPAQMAGLEGGR